MLYYHVPDGNDIAFIRKHIDGGTLIDVGANVGSVSVLLADRFEHGILSEPNPVAAARARENLAINRLSFEVHELAVSDTSGVVRLEDNAHSSSTNRTVVGFETESPTRLVPRVTFDVIERERSAALVSFLTPIVKGLLTETAIECTYHALQIFGGHGYIVEHGMEQFARDARITTLYEGTTQIQALDLLGRKVMQLQGRRA